ncbi:MAG: hypothetical protein IKD88_03715 [Lachnospiraceae bacterium]|nr:hypothetical protein [Lachnospiraceae bacterium]
MSMSAQEADRGIRILKERLDACDAVLVGAGAGLSAAAGLSYFDGEAFRKYYPDMYRLGWHYPYELVGRRDDEWTRGRKWAYWATHIHYVREIFPAAELYRKLLRVLEGHDWFVVTSNCDRQFFRNGFPMERVFEYQGNYDNMGCSAHCTTHTWNDHDALQRVLANIDHETFECREEGIPKCPYCGADAEICFRGEDWQQNADRYVRFLEQARDRKLLLIEIGVGYNTPGVIRWPFENIAAEFPYAFLVRVNTGYVQYPDRTGFPQVPRSLEGKAAAIDMDAAAVIEALEARV